MCREELELTLATCSPAAELSGTLREVKALAQHRRQALDRRVVPHCWAGAAHPSSACCGGVFVGARRCAGMKGRLHAVCAAATEHSRGRLEAVIAERQELLAQGPSSLLLTSVGMHLAQPLHPFLGTAGCQLALCHSPVPSAASWGWAHPIPKPRGTPAAGLLLAACITRAVSSAGHISSDVKPSFPASAGPQGTCGDRSCVHESGLWFPAPWVLVWRLLRRGAWLEEVSQKVVGGFVLVEIARRLQVSA